jgi:hypothetical protein
MRRSPVSARFAACLSVCLALVLAGCGWGGAPLPTGTWGGWHPVSVRLPTGATSFEFQKDTVEILMTVHPDRSVTGHIGKAKFSGCRVASNRGWFERLLDLNTDYVVLGDLSGAIYPRDRQIGREISIPFSLERDSLMGSVFQVNAAGVYPMVTVRLARYELR